MINLTYTYLYDVGRERIKIGLNQSCIVQYTMINSVNTMIIHTPLPRPVQAVPRLQALGEIYLFN